MQPGACWTAGKSSPELLAFITELNVLVNEYKDILLHQRSKKKGKTGRTETGRTERIVYGFGF